MNGRSHYKKQPSLRVLNIPSCSLSTGERVFIYGPFEKGKSTLIKLLCGSLLPNTGLVQS
ncbi:MAG TPA: hypothetical protein DCZ03_03180 [Gammaproteobacteria bacterium]|nr:hypothetical protein [Gammaproteobacteria bacterium]